MNPAVLSDGVRPASDQGQTPEPLLPHQQLTVGVIAAWIIGALALNLSLGLSAFAASAGLLFARAADDGAAVRGMPWGIISQDQAERAGGYSSR